VWCSARGGAARARSGRRCVRFDACGLSRGLAVSSPSTRRSYCEPRQAVQSAWLRRSTSVTEMPNFSRVDTTQDANTACGGRRGLGGQPTDGRSHCGGDTGAHVSGAGHDARRRPPHGGVGAVAGGRFSVPYRQWSAHSAGDAAAHSPLDREEAAISSVSCCYVELPHTRHSTTFQLPSTLPVCCRQLQGAARGSDSVGGGGEGRTQRRETWRWWKPSRRVVNTWRGCWRAPPPCPPGWQAGVWRERGERREGRAAEQRAR
jgi:hypothetical protein